MVVITLIKSVIINHKNQDLDIIVVCQISLQNPVFPLFIGSTHRSESSFSGGGCNRVLNTFPSCSYICFLVSSLFSSSQSFRFYSFFSPLCCSLLIATSLSSLLHSGEQQCVCVCVYSCIVSRTHFSSHRYLAIIAPTLSSHTTLSRFTCTRRYSLLVVTTKRQ
jgi:hypothetical protein